MKSDRGQDSLITAIDLAIAGDWQRSHQIVQDLESSEAYLIHAILHKIEGDRSNSSYWYRRAKSEYNQNDPIQELGALKMRLASSNN
jgi:hypothetical protein